jgi:hypothetical protein
MRSPAGVGLATPSDTIEVNAFRSNPTYARRQEERAIIDG